MQTNSKKGYKDGNELVLRTLDQIKEVGFTVVRTWAYQDDPDPNKGGALQYKDTKGECGQPLQSQTDVKRQNSFAQSTAQLTWTRMLHDAAGTANRAHPALSMDAPLSRLDTLHLHPERHKQSSSSTMSRLHTAYHSIDAVACKANSTFQQLQT